MAEQILYAINLPPHGAWEPGDAASGWLLSEARIERVFALDGGRGRREVTYGLPRPDVVRHFPGYPNGEACGFLLEGGVPSREVRLLIELERRFGVPRRRFAAIDVGIYGLQRGDLPTSLDGLLAVRAERRLSRTIAEVRSLTLTVDIINKCNLRCVMCHYSQDDVFKRPREEMDLDVFRDRFELIGPHVRKVMLSCADEPLLSRQFPDFLTYLADRHPEVEVSFATNAMLLSDRIRRHLIETGVIEIVASLDGVRRATVERIRVGSDYRRIVANLLALADLKEASGTRFPLLTMDFIMFASNIDEAPAYVALAHRLHARAIDYRHVIPSTFYSAEGEQLAHDPGRFNAYREIVVEEGRRLGVTITMPPPFPGAPPFTQRLDLATLEDFVAVTPDHTAPGSLTSRRPRDYEPRTMGPSPAAPPGAIFCERPYTELVITKDMVRPCAFYDAPLGSIGSGKSLREIFLGDQFRRLRRQMLRPEGDPGCHACPIKAGYVTSKPAIP